MPPLPKTWVEDRDTDILVESWSNSAQTIQVRGISDTEQIFHNHTTNSDRSIATSSFSINAIPRFITAKAASTGLKRGQCYVKISLRAEGVVIACLVRGYISDTSVLMYPYGPNEAANSGRGFIRSISGTDPAAGIDVSETVPTGATWRPLAFLFTLVTDATVITRTPYLLFDDGATTYARMQAVTGITASLTSIITFSTVGATGGSGTFADAGFIPQDLFMMAGHRIRSAILNLQAGDNIGAPIYLVEEFISP